MENFVLVFFDVSDDRIRNRIVERCFDFGLIRVQYSGFAGRLSRNKREELYLKILREIGDYKDIRLIIQPICEKCLENVLSIGEFKLEDDVPEVKEEKIDNIWNLPYNFRITED